MTSEQAFRDRKFGKNKHRHTSNTNESQKGKQRQINMKQQKQRVIAPTEQENPFANGRALLQFQMKQMLMSKQDKKYFINETNKDQVDE